MLDTLMDFISLSALYSLYGSIFLVILNFLWIWNVEYQFITSAESFSNESYKELGRYYNHLNPVNNNVINWIIKYIRRKVCSSDDEDIQVILPTN